PLVALAVLQLEVVPDREGLDLRSVLALDPERDVGPMIFGDVQARDIDADGGAAGERRRAHQAGDGRGDDQTHGADLMNGRTGSEAARERSARGRPSARWRAAAPSGS